MLKSTGFPAYDSKIQSKIRGEWRYEPYNVNGKAVPVCTAVTFIYSRPTRQANEQERAMGLDLVQILENSQHHR